MNCEQARTEIIAYLKGELNAATAAKLEEHLARCPACRHELESARKLLAWTEAASDETVIKTVDEIINNAIKANASDIHFEPQRDNTLRVRYRVDGVMHETLINIEATQRYGILSRVKMLADMNVTETGQPQDGRIMWTMYNKDYDLRVSSIPYVFGDGIVIRILDKSGILLGMNKLGFSEDHINEISNLLNKPNGMIITTGPTGSGKTTTVYSMLLKQISPEKNVVSIENPVEYSLKGMNQAQVRSATGFTYAQALRSFLRSDPDIIYVGEIRDRETAIISAEAAVTGHLVLTTLFANDAISSMQRLLDIGIEPFIISATLIGVISQRLARMVCRDCGKEIEVDLNDPTIRFFGITSNDLRNHKIRRGTGCETCRYTGYKGRIGLYEVLTIDHELSNMISNGVTDLEFVEAARSKGFRTMREDAKQKVLDGITSPEEAFRVLSWMP